MNNSKSLGSYGESLAVYYLKRHNYEIISNNYRIGRSEFDLVAKKNKELIFFEIKTRHYFNKDFQDSLITKKQNNNLKRGINAYCLKNHISLDVVHLDLLLIIVDQSTKLIRFKHYRDIF